MAFGAVVLALSDPPVGAVLARRIGDVMDLLLALTEDGVHEL